MQKKKLKLLVLIGVFGIASANASSTAKITALKSPVWLQQENGKTKLKRNSILKIGDSIATGDTGRVEMLLWVNATLQLNANTEITIRAKNGIDQADPGAYPELYIHQGRACIDYKALSSSEKKFVVNISDMMFVAIHLHGDVCVLRGDGLSSIILRSGSVQITHAIDPNMIVLSEAGTEIHIEDDGAYEFLYPDTVQSTTLEIEKPFVIETDIEKNATGDTVDGDNSATEEFVAAEPGTTQKNDQSGYIYTVYLFSTGSEEVAERANRKFRGAGHNSHIYEIDSGSATRYRVAVSGFESSRAAKAFSGSVVGTLGITETWTGKNLR